MWHTGMYGHTLGNLLVPPNSTYPYCQFWDTNSDWDSGGICGLTSFHPGGEWVMDSGVTAHVTNSTGNLTSSHSPTNLNSRSIIVGDGSLMPIYSVGSTTLAPHPFRLNHVLVSPAIIKSLISVRQFTRDNACSIEFDPYGFSVKDLATRSLLLRSSSSGDLYPFFGDLRNINTALTVSTTRDL
jgi:hypothetical protein